MSSPWYCALVEKISSNQHKQSKGISREIYGQIWIHCPSIEDWRAKTWQGSKCEEVNPVDCACRAYSQEGRSTLAQEGSPGTHLQQHMPLQTQRFSATARPELWEKPGKRGCGFQLHYMYYTGHTWVHVHFIIRHSLQAYNTDINTFLEDLPYLWQVGRRYRSVDTESFFFLPEPFQQRREHVSRYMLQLWWSHMRLISN